MKSKLLLFIFIEMLTMAINYIEEKITSNQVSIAEEIYEETKQLSSVVMKNWDIIEEFLCNYQNENKAVMISTFDFTGDGIEEIIMSKAYLATVTAPVSYNYVFDSEGEKILEFAWSYPSDAEIYTIETNNGKEKFYLTGYMDFAAHNNLWIYGEIFYDGKELKEELVFMEWDTRYEIDRNNNVDEGHFVFYKPKEADDALWQGYEGIVELSKTEETVNPDMLGEYIEKQNIIESKEVIIVGCILYENNQFIWESAQ